MLGENIGLLRVGYKANFFATDKDLLAIEPAGLEGMHARCLFMRGKRYKPRHRGISALLQLLATRPHTI